LKGSVLPIRQDRLSRRIGETDPFKDHLPGHLSQPLCIGRISLFGLLVHHLEDTLRAGQGSLEGIIGIGQFIDRPGELL